MRPGTDEVSTVDDAGVAGVAVDWEDERVGYRGGKGGSGSRSLFPRTVEPRGERGGRLLEELTTGCTTSFVSSSVR